LMGVNGSPSRSGTRRSGRVYRGLIDAGIHSFMIGHNAMPAYTRALRPASAMRSIMPPPLAGAAAGPTAGQTRVQRLS
jgi:beta-N-acetylhexosaminidase